MKNKQMGIEAFFSHPCVVEAEKNRIKRSQELLDRRIAAYMEGKKNVPKSSVSLNEDLILRQCQVCDEWNYWKTNQPDFEGQFSFDCQNCETRFRADRNGENGFKYRLWVRRKANGIPKNSNK